MLVQGRRRKVLVALARVRRAPSRREQVAAACPVAAQTLRCLAHLDEDVLVVVRAWLDSVPAALTVLGVAVQRPDATDQARMFHRLVAEAVRNQAGAGPKPSAEQAGLLQLTDHRVR